MNRLNIRISDEALARLRGIVRVTEAQDMTAVVRRALAVYDDLAHAARRGEKLVIRAQDGSEREVLILW